MLNYHELELNELENHLQEKLYALNNQFVGHPMNQDTTRRITNQVQRIIEETIIQLGLRSVASDDLDIRIRSDGYNMVRVSIGMKKDMI